VVLFLGQVAAFSWPVEVAGFDPKKGGAWAGVHGRRRSGRDEHDPANDFA
jgi:hypothetical protein